MPEKIAVGGGEYWENEFYMRNSAMHILKHITNNETVIVSDDLDEIIKFEKVAQWRPEQGITASFELRFSYYFFNQ